MKILLSLVLVFLIISCIEKTSLNGENHNKNNHFKMNKVFFGQKKITKEGKTIQYLFSPNGEDTLHVLILDSVKNISFNKGRYYSLFMDNKMCKNELSVTVNSVEVPGLIRNLIVFCKQKETDSLIFSDYYLIDKCIQDLKINLSKLNDGEYIEPYFVYGDTFSDSIYYYNSSPIIEFEKSNSSDTCFLVKSLNNPRGKKAKTYIKYIGE